MAPRFVSLSNLLFSQKISTGGRSSRCRHLLSLYALPTQFVAAEFYHPDHIGITRFRTGNFPACGSTTPGYCDQSAERASVRLIQFDCFHLLRGPQVCYKPQCCALHFCCPRFFRLFWVSFACEMSPASGRPWSRTLHSQGGA